MPQRVNSRSFVPGDARAMAAGRKGGKASKPPILRSRDYVAGYRAGARNARRHIERWIREMSEDAS